MPHLLSNAKNMPSFKEYEYQGQSEYLPFCQNFSTILIFIFVTRIKARRLLCSNLRACQLPGIRHCKLFESCDIHTQNSSECTLRIWVGSGSMVQYQSFITDVQRLTLCYEQQLHIASIQCTKACPNQEVNALYKYRVQHLSLHCGYLVALAWTSQELTKYLLKYEAIEQLNSSIERPA